MCVPSQVAQVVIRGVAVVMATFHPFGAWPNERSQHKAVDADCDISRFVLEVDGAISGW